jgi:hypothetical protein
MGGNSCLQTYRNCITALKSPNGIIVLEKKVGNMVTVDIKLSLPETLLKDAQSAGLLSPMALERLLQEEIRRRRVDNLFAAMDRLAAVDLPPLSDKEIAEEIRLARKSRR